MAFGNMIGCLTIFLTVILCSSFIAVSAQTSGQLIFQEEFDTLDRNRWQHLITAWRGGNAEFQYYTNRTENRYRNVLKYFTKRKFYQDFFLLISFVRDGVLFIKPTLTSHRFSNDFLYNGVLNLNKEGCNIPWENGCYVYKFNFAVEMT